MLRLFGQAAQSVARLRLAMALDPRNAIALLSLALANRDRGDRAFALSGLDAAIDLDPTVAMAWLERGNLHRLARRFPEALDDLSRAVVLDPSQANSFALLGSCLLAMFHPDRAEVVYRRWIDLAPGNARAYRELASTLHSQGRIMEAEPYWRRDLELAERTAIRASPAWSGRRLLRDLTSTTRIGEIVKMLDIHVKTGKLGWRPDFRAVIAGNVTAYSNLTFLDYWKSHVDIVTEPAEVRQVFSDARRAEQPTRATRISDGRVLHGDYAWHAVQTAWEAAGRSPVLTLKPEHFDHGRRYLVERGMPADAWFVAFHIRESGFFRENYENARSCLAESYIPAIERIHAHGGWVCRMGDPTMAPLPGLPNFIDITRFERRDEALDIFLIASARFLVCTLSGPTSMAVCFGTPQLQTNAYPITERAWCSGDRFMPKLYRDLSTGRPISFGRSIGSKVVVNDHVQTLRRLGYEVIDNTAEEIVDAVEDMLTLTANRDPDDGDTRQLQDRYDNCCRPKLPVFCSRIAGSFIRRHAALLDNHGALVAFALPERNA